MQLISPREKCSVFQLFADFIAPRFVVLFPFFDVVVCLRARFAVNRIVVLESFAPTDPAFEPSLHQHRSPPSGNAILRGRDKVPERALEIQSTDCRDKWVHECRRFGAICRKNTSTAAFNEKSADESWLRGVQPTFPRSSSFSGLTTPPNRSPI
jgi:hypothetical protein